MAEVLSRRAAAKQLKAFYDRNGYLRQQNPKRLAKEGRDYKKGDEIRLVAASAAELKEIRRLLKAAGFTPGNPFQKSNQWRQPLYGRQAVADFLKLIGKRKPPAKKAAKATPTSR